MPIFFNPKTPTLGMLALEALKPLPQVLSIHLCLVNPIVEAVILANMIGLLGYPTPINGESHGK